MTAIVTPDRSVQQRMMALAQANVIRQARAADKKLVRAGTLNVRGILADPPAHWETAKVLTLLLAAPGLGPVKSRRVLEGVKAAQSKTVGGLSGRQRVELLARLR